MDRRKYLLSETGRIAAGQLLCCAVMVSVFAIMGKLDTAVILGAAIGAVTATLNFYIMALCADAAARKAAKQDITGGKTMIQYSYLGRLLGLFAILALCARSGMFHPLALVLPLAFTGPVLMIAAFFSKKGGKAQ